MDALGYLRAQRPEVESLCREYAVKRLRLFGSAAKGTWNSTSSDFDFVVEFNAVPESMHPFDQCFRFKEELEAILGRTVDLVELSAVHNPYFLRLLEGTARDFYAA